MNNIKQHLSFIALALAICGGFIYLYIFHGLHYLADENGWLENLQVATLVLAMLGFAGNAFKLSSRARMQCSFFAILMWLFIMREVDFDKLNIANWLIFLLAEQGRALFYTIAFGLLFYELAHWKFYWNTRHIWLGRSFFAYITIAAWVLIIFSTGFEKQIFDVPHHQLFEEVSEAFAYFLLLGAAVFAQKSLK